jgi:hypothetical protein
MAFKKGTSGNPGGRVKDNVGPYNLPALARTYTAQALKRIGQILDDETAPPAVVLRAAEIVFDRGWGKPAQTVAVEVTDTRSPEQLTRDELAERAAAILAGAGQGDPGGVSRPN